MSDAELKQLNTALNRNREHRETIKRLTKELEAYKAEDTPAFEEVCMRNQSLTADLAAMTADRDRLREVVEGIEWSGSTLNGPVRDGGVPTSCCPSCGGIKRGGFGFIESAYGHRNGCVLGQALAAREQQADAKGVE